MVLVVMMAACSSDHRLESKDETGPLPTDPVPSSSTGETTSDTTETTSSTSTSSTTSSTTSDTWTYTGPTTDTGSTPDPDPVCEAPVACSRVVDPTQLGDCTGDPALLNGTAHGSVQAALDASADGDIVWVCPGVWSEHLVVPTDRDVSLVAVDPMWGATVLDGGGAGLILRATGGALVVDGLGFENGQSDFGGGIATDGTDLTVTCSRFIGNVSWYSGAGVNASGETTVTTSAFCGNQSLAYGGGLNLRAQPDTTTTLTLSDSLFAGNAAQNGGGLGIGGDNEWHVDYDTIAQQLVMTNVHFLGNEASWGGGLATQEGALDLTITGGLFQGNSSYWTGGAVDFAANDFPMAVRFLDTPFLTNSAGSAGGAIMSDGTADTVLVLDGVTLWDNTSGVGTSAAVHAGTGWVHCLGCDLGTGADDNSPADLANNHRAVSGLGAGSDFVLVPEGAPEPWDADGDGLQDSDEALMGTDPSLADTDGDYLPDSYEGWATGTDPLVADSDGGGVVDGLEMLMGCDPLDGADDGGC